MHPRRSDHLLGAAFVVMWSSGFVGAALGTRDAPASTLLAWRFIIAMPPLVAWLGWRRRRISPRDLALHLLIGILGQGGYLYGVFLAAEHGVAEGTISLITALQPLVAVMLAVPVLGEPIGRRQLGGFLGGLAGVALVVGGDLDGGAPGWAYALPFASMLSLVAATLIERRARPAAALPEALAVQAGVSTMLFSGIAGVNGSLAPPLEPRFWTAIGILVLLAMFGGYGLYWVNVQRTGVAHISALLYLTPPTTMLLGYAMFGSTLPPLSLLGILICAVAVTVALRTPARSGAQADLARKPPDPREAASGESLIAAPSAATPPDRRPRSAASYRCAPPNQG
ncbi:DMT family transporter [Actinomadura napierensis]|uniref:DMT family transporter n=1 Tax=Actinomadura napierensis TaxID=267854 RepID=A0ABN3AGX2_9ACTN